MGFNTSFLPISEDRLKAQKYTIHTLPYLTTFSSRLLDLLAPSLSPLLMSLERQEECQLVWLKCSNLMCSVIVPTAYRCARGFAGGGSLE